MSQFFLFSFTVPIDKENINPNVKRFVNSQQRAYEYIETKDGFCYSLEFNSVEEQNKFKIELQTKFPKIYF